jgi:hypothetical protein
MSAPARRKKEKKNVEKNGEKPIFIFTGRILLLFCSASSVCKIDITLYIISFFGKVLQAHQHLRTAWGVLLKNI